MTGLAQQHERWLPARDRLWNGQAPSTAEPRSRPVSPFARDVEERREEQRRLAQERLDRAMAGLRANWSPHWFAIVTAVAKKHGISPNMSESRRRYIIKARHECFYRMRHEITVLGKPMSFPMIAEKFGGMDHSTIHHGVSCHARRLEAQAGEVVIPTIHITHTDGNKSSIDER